MGRGASLMLRRRDWLARAVAMPLGGLAACHDAALAPPARWLGASHERGHRVRDMPARPGDALPRRAAVLVVGAGIAGLGAARALTRAGVDDVHLLELEDAPGGNSRGHVMAGMACPLGAHYLPLPGPHALEVRALLDEFGLLRSVHGRDVPDERHLCHSPQERLFIDGAWHEGLLPALGALPASQRGATLAQYRRFAALVEQHGAGAAFRIPTARAPWTPALAALDTVPFAAWLGALGLDAPALRWYLDYCCRDDYGAGSAQVSAWAGLHYFASRHGFHAPGEGDDAEPGGVFTWPEGNAWLVARMAAPLRERIHAGRVALRVEEGRHDVVVDAWDAGADRAERWTARAVVLAVPLFVAQRLVVAPPDALRAAAAMVRHAPWLVANLHLTAPLLDRPGVPPAWDNVRYAGGDLGYVDAMHQSTRPYAGATVLTAYRALGGDSPQALAENRRRLLDVPAHAWAQVVLDDLSAVHPDLRRRVAQVDLMRYGHAMSIPVPGLRSHAALRALAEASGRVSFAHADLSAYSVFEEALHHGERAAGSVLAAQRRAA
jgi:monoamine oxidase